MSQQNIDLGTFPDDPSADAIRTAFQKVQNNFNQLFGANANSTVTSINRTPGAGITVNYPTGNVVVSANIACVQVSTSSLSIGRGGNGGTNATITSSAQTLVVDINPNLVLSNYFANSSNGLAVFNGNLSSNSNAQPNLTSLGTLTGLNVSGNANFTGSNTYIANISNLHIPGGTVGYFLQTDGAGNLAWASGGGGGGGSPGGINTYVQFNYQGTFAGQSGFTYNNVSSLLSVPNITVSGNITAANLVGAYSNGNSNISIVGNSNIVLTANSVSTMTVTKTGANITGTANISGNITSGNANLGNLTTSNYFHGVLDSTSSSQPNITSVGTLANLTSTGNINTTGELNVTNNNEHGGTGYAGIMTMTNTGAGTNPNKYLRINSTGNLQIINSGYSATIFDLSDAGNLSQISTLSVSGNANVGNLNIANNAVIAGNLIVQGNATYYNITSFNVQDPIISVGGGANGAPLTTDDGKDRGLQLLYYTTTPVSAFMGWDTGNGEFSFGSNVSISAGEIVTYNALGNVRGLTWLGNVDGAYANFTGNIYTTGNANLGNTVTANYFVGRFYGNANAATVANTVVDNAQPNITSVGTLTSLAVTGNTSSGNFIGKLANGNSNISITADSNIGFNAVGVSIANITGTGINVAGTGNFTGNLAAAAYYGPLANGNSNVQIASANGNVTLTAVGNTTMTISGTGANITGTGNISGNLSAGNINGGNLVTANFISGDGYLLSNLSITAGSTIVNGNSNVTVAANGNVTMYVTGNTTARLTATSTGVVANGTINVSGNANVGNLGTAQVLASANITSPQLISNIATGTAPLIVTSTTQVANLSVATAALATYATTANAVAGANVSGAVSFATTANAVAGANVSGTVANATYATSAGSATTAGTVTTAAQGNITSVGTLTSLAVNGTVTAVAFTANTGVFTGNGNGLSSLVGANVTGTVANATYAVTAGTANAVAGANVSGTVANANVSIYGAVTTQTTGTFYPVFVSGNTTANYAQASNANLSFNAATGNLSATILSATYLRGDGSNISNLNISAGSSIVNGTSNVSIPGSNGNVNTVVAGNTTLVVTGTGANITGTANISGNANVGNLGFGSGVITGTGNITGGNLIGIIAAGSNTITTTGNANVGNLGFGSGVITGTGNITAGNIIGIIAAGSNAITTTGNISAGNVTVTSYHLRSVATSISAAGTTQGTATALTKEINVVSTVASGANGVVLPTAVAGMVLTITNTSANSLSVYPATGGTINSLAANGAFTQVANATLQFIAPTTTQWYTVGATYT
jgi:hypothetical protein